MSDSKSAPSARRRSEPAGRVPRAERSKPQDSGVDKNFNISAYRVLYILLLLVQHQALGIEALNKALFENALIQRTYNSETITKYINTLRRVGCKIPKSTSRFDYRYVLAENPFPATLTDEELAATHAILRVLACQPDVGLHEQYRDFLGRLAWMLPAGQRDQLMIHLTHPVADWTPDERRRLLSEYKEYCIDAQILEVAYQVDGIHTTVMQVEPIRVVQEAGQLFLLGVDRPSRSQVKLNLEKVMGRRQLPSKIQPNNKSTMVVFQLYDRLARTYRLYPGEEIVFRQGDTLQIHARTDDLNGLMRRLMKYNTLCQVISPASARSQMRQNIAQLLMICQHGSEAATEADNALAAPPPGEDPASADESEPVASPDGEAMGSAATAVDEGAASDTLAPGDVLAARNNKTP